MRRILIGVAAALVLLAGALGAAALVTAPNEAVAQETEEDTETFELENITRADRVESFIDEALADLVTGAVITQEQAEAVKDALLASLKEHRAEFEDRIHRFGPRLRGALHFGLDAAAEAIGIDTEDLWTAMRDDGLSIAQVGEANGIPSADVVDAVVAETSTRIDQIAADRGLDPDRVEKFKARLPEFVERFVNFEPGSRFGDSGFRFFGDETGVTN